MESPAVVNWNEERQRFDDDIPHAIVADREAERFD
jgi:hypothetical protein